MVAVSGHFEAAKGIISQMNLAAKFIKGIKLLYNQSVPRILCFH